MLPLHPLFLGFLVALGIGLLIGIDRERKKGEGPTRQAAGLRTFTLTALLGAVAIAAGGELLLAAAALGVVAFAGLSYWRARDSDPGLPTETAPGPVALPRPPATPHRALPPRPAGRAAPAPAPPSRPH